MSYKVELEMLATAVVPSRVTGQGELLPRWLVLMSGQSVFILRKPRILRRAG